MEIEISAVTILAPPVQLILTVFSSIKMTSN